MKSILFTILSLLIISACKGQELKIWTKNDRYVIYINSDTAFLLFLVFDKPKHYGKIEILLRNEKTDCFLNDRYIYQRKDGKLGFIGKNTKSKFNGTYFRNADSNDLVKWRGVNNRLLLFNNYDSIHNIEVEKK